MASITDTPYLYACIAVFLLILYRVSPFHPLYGIPGPILFQISELPMIFFVLRGTHHRVVRELHQKYGQALRIGPNTVSFTSLSAITKIYGSSQALEKTSAYDLHLIKGEGLFFIKEKASHIPRRRIWNRSFSKEALEQYQHPIASQVENLVYWLVERTKTNGSIDLVKILPQYAYDSTNSVFFSGTAFHPSLLDSDDKDSIVNEASGYFGAFGFFSHAQPFFHIIKHLPGISTFFKFEAFATEAARRRLEKGSPMRDGISYWLEGEDDQPTLAHKDLPIESATLLIGGSETIGAISTFLFYFLLTNQKWLIALREELDHILPDESFHGTFGILDELPLLNAIIQETLRLGTPMPGLPRLVPKGGITIDGLHFPGGTCVSVPAWTHHTDKRYFPNPYEFNPERWIEGGKFMASRGTILTFGGGPFNCVGSKLAYLQLRILVVLLLLHLDFTLAEGFDPAKFWGGIRNRRATTFLEPLCIKASPRKI
ncbi:cytochrome P450 [Gymnopus androsaceus JB14]|uniref:Cytochrome P450 n=1 Tax=Gymnopus androsaceus JB14 TaxID=1447944 RepID=A0A6A4GP91_9AGAR|nr:cytochrome P450 [Gymnopus androsaceus JB14]